MADLTPPLSQENQPPSSPPLGELPLSSPPIAPTQPSNTRARPKRPPTVTPRTFTRFFTPKSLAGPRKVSSSRRVLRQISASAANSRAQRSRARVNDCHCDQQLQDADDANPRASKLRKINHSSPLSSPLFSSPTRAPDIKKSNEPDEEEQYLTNKATYPAAFKPSPAVIKKVRFDHQRPGLARSLHGPATSNYEHAQMRKRFDAWQNETAGFYSDPDDIHRCNILQGENAFLGMPYCVEACNTNSLVAIGDEAGIVRLLESSDDSPAWSEPVLRSEKHSNAILDMSFSPDDLLLATASGDQSTSITDMMAHKTLYSLSGHVSSVKQVHFQPNSSSILATSSRDGSIQLYDLRVHGLSAPIRHVKTDHDPSAASMGSQHAFLRPINAMYDAHKQSPHPSSTSATALTRHSQSRLASANIQHSFDGNQDTSERSVTTLLFLPDRPHLLLSGAASSASMSLWDIRTTHSRRSRAPIPLSVIPSPTSHISNKRRYGLTSLAVNTRGDRIYTLCRDNTIYAYSTSHLILGSAPELNTDSRPSHYGPATSRSGIGPLYGFRHPLLHVSSFYVKMSLRHREGANSECLAVGSNSGSPILFPTEESLLSQQNWPLSTSSAELASRPGLRRGLSSNGKVWKADDIPIYDSGTALTGGHEYEVTGVCWSQGGRLVSVSDDNTARLWREGERAKELRTEGEGGGNRWRSGWAEVTEGWDDDGG